MMQPVFPGPEAVAGALEETYQDQSRRLDSLCQVLSGDS